MLISFWTLCQLLFGWKSEGYGSHFKDILSVKKVINNPNCGMTHCLLITFGVKTWISQKLFVYLMGQTRYFFPKYP